MACGSCLRHPYMESSLILLNSLKNGYLATLDNNYVSLLERGSDFE